MKPPRLAAAQKRMLRNDVARRCFREVADKDYIAARNSYRFGLIEPFLWSALQATEKHLKAILLYNACSTKKLNHDVVKAFNRVTRIPDIAFDFPDSVPEFLSYLERHASSRYLERPYYTRGRELLSLDHTVWHLRRYCQDLRRGPKDMDESAALEMNLRTIAVTRWEHQPHRFRLFGGYLERVLDGRIDVDVRKALVWKNPYYGVRFRRFLRNYKLRSQSANPPHYLNKAAYFAVRDLVFFSEDVVRDMEAEESDG